MKNPPKTEFARCDRPPSLGRIINILRIGDKETKTLVVLSTSLYGCYTHWTFTPPKGRTVRCASDRRKCAACKKELPRKWLGFLCVTGANGKGVCFLELTPYAAELFLDQVKDRVDCRGMIIVVHRERASNRSPLIVTHAGEYQGEEPLPAAADPENTLRRLWGVHIDS